MKKQVLLFVLMLMPLIANADKVIIDGIYYNLNSTDQVAKVTSGPTDYTGSIVIPETVTYEGSTYSVTSIERYAFYVCSGLTSVVIPNSITCIGYWAFRACRNLISVIIPKGVTEIDGGAFENCSSLTSIIIPEGVTEIDDDVFSGCSSLTSVIIPEGVNSIGECAFMGCSSLTSIIIPEGVTKIDDDAFKNCSSLTSVIIPEGVTSIDDGAFTGCSSLTSVNIPKSVESIGSSIFSGCKKLTTVQIAYGATAISNYAFQSCTSLDSISIPSTIKVIGNYAFDGCNGLTKVSVGRARPIAINNSTFSNRSNATLYVPKGSKIAYQEADYWKEFKEIVEQDSYGICFALDDENGMATVVNVEKTYSGAITIPANVTNNNKTYIVVAIGEGAFQNATGLTSISIPSSVTSIGDNAFDGCSDLLTVTVAWETPIVINSTVFPNSGDVALHVPSGRELAYASADNWKDFKTIAEPIVFADNVVEVLCIANWDADGDGELYKDEAAVVRGLLSVFENTDITTFNELQYFTGLKSIGFVEFYDDGYYSSFSGCNNLTSIIIPGGVTAIGNDAFSGCSSLTSIIIPEGVTSIGYGAFNGCSSLTSVVIPEGVTSIGGSAFDGCRSMTTVSIPKSVTSIGCEAFSFCENLKSVYIYIQNSDEIELGECMLVGGPSYPNNPFSRFNNNDIILYVPHGSRNSYIEGWGSLFNKIIEFSDNDDLNNLNTITTRNYYSSTNGGKIDFSIEMINDSKIQSLECDIYLPNGLSFITDDNSNANIIWNDKRRPTGEFVDNSYTVSDKHVHISGMGHENTFIGNNGEVVRIGIKADKDLEDGTYPILMRNIKLKDYSNEYQSDSLYSYVEVDGFKDYHLVNIDGIGYNLYMDGKAEVANAIVVADYYWNDDLIEVIGSSVIDCIKNYSENWEVPQFDSNSDPMLKPEVLDTLFVYSGNIIIPEKVTYRGNSYNVTTINPHAFRGSKNMTSITIPSTITSIGMNAFLDCKGLEKVIVPDLSAWCAISFEERNANPIFRSARIYSDENTEIKDLVIPEGVERIGNYAFYNCDGITSITLPQSLTRIGSYAFYACDAINSVSIPATVTSIKEKAFYGCDSLKSITVGMTVPPTLTAQIASASRTKLYVPKGTKELYEAANYWKDFMEIIEMSEDIVITDISEMDNAFYMDEKSVVPGNRYVLPIKLKNNQLVMGYQFDLELPEGVSFALDDNGVVLATMSERGSSFIISKNKRSDRVCRFVVINASNNVLTGEDGVVMNVTVDVADDMEAGAYGVLFKNGELTIKEENAISSINLQNVTSLMNVVTALLGDVNNDGRVSVTDVVAIIGFILGNENSNFSSVAADLNGDGSITVVDAVNVINLILNDDSYSKGNGLFEMEEE